MPIKRAFVNFQVSFGLLCQIIFLKQPAFERSGH